MAELLKCEKCKIDPDIFSTDNDKQFNWHVKCWGCGTKAGGRWHTKEAAEKDWNAEQGRLANVQSNTSPSKKNMGSRKRTRPKRGASP